MLNSNKPWHVYICNRGGQLYTGITTDLEHRMNQHKAALLYSESFEDKNAAAKRERQLKGWSRAKKLELIEGTLVLSARDMTPRERKRYEES